MQLRILTTSSNRCGLSYQQIVETIANASPVVQKTAIIPKQLNLKRQREVDSENDDEPRHFRRVRMKCRQRARNRDGQDEAESEALLNLDEGTISCVCGAQSHYSVHSLSANTASACFIQCIDCKVWQHRSCVGTANGNDPPSGYYCPRCQGMMLVEAQDELMRKEVNEFFELPFDSRNSARMTSKGTATRKRVKPASMLPG